MIRSKGTINKREIRKAQKEYLPSTPRDKVQRGSPIKQVTRHKGTVARKPSAGSTSVSDRQELGVEANQLQIGLK